MHCKNALTPLMIKMHAIVGQYIFHEIMAFILSSLLLLVSFDHHVTFWISHIKHFTFFHLKSPCNKVRLFWEIVIAQFMKDLVLG